jgi:hypothetical protein
MNCGWLMLSVDSSDAHSSGGFGLSGDHAHARRHGQDPRNRHCCTRQAHQVPSPLTTMQLYMNNNINKFTRSHSTKGQVNESAVTAAREAGGTQALQVPNSPFLSFFYIQLPFRSIRTKKKEKKKAEWTLPPSEGTSRSKSCCGTRSRTSRQER